MEAASAESTGARLSKAGTLAPPMPASKRKKAAASTSGASPRKRATRRGSAPPLTAERIRDEALRLIDAEGFEQFSTRRLGAALGCEAMAIYWYYPSKDALLDAVVESLLHELPVEASPGSSYPGPGSGPPGGWIDALRRLAHGYRRLAHLHPHSFPLLATRRFATEGSYRFLESLFELARQAGLDPPTTARFFRLVASYCSGVALDELAGLREQARARAEPDATRQIDAAPGAFPRLAAVAPFLEPAHYDELFEFGLELLLDRLSASPRGTETA